MGSVQTFNRAESAKKYSPKQAKRRLGDAITKILRPERSIHKKADMSCAFSAPTKGEILPNVPFAALTLRWAIYKLRLQRESVLS